MRCRERGMRVFPSMRDLRVPTSICFSHSTVAGGSSEAKLMIEICIFCVYMGDSAKYLGEVVQKLSSCAGNGVSFASEGSEFTAHFQVEVASLWKGLLDAEVDKFEDGAAGEVLLQEHWSTKQAYPSKALAKQVLSQGLLAAFPKPFPFLGFKRLVGFIETRFPAHPFCLHLRPLSLCIKKLGVLADPDLPRNGHVAVSLNLTHSVGLLRALVLALADASELQVKSLLFQMLVKLWLKKEWLAASPQVAPLCAKVETMTTETRNKLLKVASEAATALKSFDVGFGKRRCVAELKTESPRPEDEAGPCLKFRIPSFRSPHMTGGVSFVYAHPITKTRSARVTLTPVNFYPLVDDPDEEDAKGREGLLALEVCVQGYAAAHMTSKEATAHLHHIGLVVLLNLLFANTAYKHLTFGSLSISAEQKEHIVRTRELRPRRSLSPARRPLIKPGKSSSTDAYLEGLLVHIRSAPVARSFLNEVVQLLRSPGVDAPCLQRSKIANAATWTLSNLMWPIIPLSPVDRDRSTLRYIEVDPKLRSPDGVHLLTKAMLGLETILLGTCTMDQVQVSSTCPFPGTQVDLKAKEAEEACAATLICLLHLTSVTRLKLGSGLSVLFHDFNQEAEYTLTQFLKRMSKQAPSTHYQFPTTVEDRLTVVLNGSAVCSNPLRPSLSKSGVKQLWYLFTELVLVALFPSFFAPSASAELLARFREQLKLPALSLRSRSDDFRLLMRRLESLGLDVNSPLWPGVEALLSEYLMLVVNDDVWRPLVVLLEGVLESSLPQLRLKFAGSWARWSAKMVNPSSTAAAASMRGSESTTRQTDSDFSGGEDPRQTVPSTADFFDQDWMQRDFGTQTALKSQSLVSSADPAVPGIGLVSAIVDNNYNINTDFEDLENPC
eukprot:Protomagalhaensia_sp_Gyna_25__1723@NODE_18_length_8108_cov_32_477630_g12_i0_p1_GENE_NODE_18_length_8108_cov_32_477630_g12_i0NODE_18_length_8108_cov_32_477630_g12_i0_p1_ORF_typecomplete_len892_score125_37_NODE_18_length_8108_cov_32_477630_g12_i033436018